MEAPAEPGVCTLEQAQGPLFLGANLGHSSGARKTNAFRRLLREGTKPPPPILRRVWTVCDERLRSARLHGGSQQLRKRADAVMVAVAARWAQFLCS